MTISTQWNLLSRPTGEPTAADVETVEVELAPVGEGEVRVQNEFLSVDPYMRGRMNDARSYVAPYALGEAMTGGAVGRVIESRSDALAVGDTVQHMLGWRDVSQGPADQFRPAPRLDGLPLSLHLSVLGVTGLTAWIGLERIARMHEGDVVFVSGAAGGVGTMVGQIARLKGASRVIGSAGTPEKLALLTDKYGFDAVFDYKAGDIIGQLEKAAPEGIDVYFDNVGGEHLEAALNSFNDGGRAALCGSISTYNTEGEAPGVRFMSNMVTRGLTMTGFTVGNHLDAAAAFRADMTGWLAAGEIVFDETIVDGIEHAFDAFTAMMRGGNIGKMIVRL